MERVLVPADGGDGGSIIPIEAPSAMGLLPYVMLYDVKAFVDTNPLIRWCPSPGCCRAVRLNVSSDNSSAQQFTLPMTSASGLGGAGARNSQQRMKFSRSVDCGSEHTFCWSVAR